MPIPPRINGELRDWYFDIKHNLIGKSYGDTRGLFKDGEERVINTVRYWSEYDDHFIVKTYWSVFILYKKEARFMIDLTKNFPAYKLWPL